MHCKGFVEDFANKVIEKLDVYVLIHNQGAYSDRTTAVVGIYNSLDLAVKNMLLRLTNTKTDQQFLECLDSKIPEIKNMYENSHYSMQWTEYVIKKFKMNDLYSDIENPAIIESDDRRYMEVMYHLLPIKSSEPQVRQEKVIVYNGFCLVSVKSYGCCPRLSLGKFLQKVSCRCKEHISPTNTNDLFHSDTLDKFNEKWELSALQR